MNKFLGLGLLAGLLLATVAGCQATRAGYETAPYRVLRRDGPVEVRAYPALQVAETPSGGDDFMRLFRYISKENSGGQKIAMTTPVFMSGVGSGVGSPGRKMAFVLPGTLEQPPTPKDAQVQVRRTEAGTFAVLRFRGGQQGPDGVAAQKLRAWLASQDLPAVGEPQFAYFDPPWTPGFLRRNEVMIPVRWTGTEPASRR